MNYLDLINNFWAKDMEFHFSDGETALYFYLLNMSNTLHWKNPFRLSNAMMIAKFGWGRTSFERSRSRLQKAGLIDFRQGSGRGKVSQYTLMDKEQALMQKVYEKDDQNDTLLEENIEKVLEKGTQTDTLLDENIGKVHEKDDQNDTLSEKVLEKGDQTNTLSDQKPEKVLEKGAQTDTLSVHLLSPEAQFSQDVQEASKHKRKHKDIPLIFFDIDNKNKKNKEIREIEAEQEKRAVEMYHRMCISFPRVTRITTSRKEKIWRRLAEMGGLPVLEKVLQKMEASDFLKGNNTKGWTASFDWVFENPDNWVKIIEGNYDNKSPTSKNDARFSGLLQTDLSKF